MPRPWPRRRPAAGRVGDERGQAAIEFALVSVLFLTLAFGLFDFARLYQSWITVQNAAREGARWAVTGRAACTGYTDNRPACIVQVAKNATKSLKGGGTSGANVTVTYRSYDYDPDNLTNPWSSTANENSAGKPCDQIEVTVTYKHHFTLPVLMALAPSGKTLVGQQRLAGEAFGPCV